MPTQAQIEERFEREQDEYVREVAIERYRSGDTSYDFSTGICGLVTAGYGELDDNGYFEYPLLVNQDTYEILVGYSSKVKEQQEIVLLVTGDTEEDMLVNFKAIINHPKVVSAYEAREEKHYEH